MLFPSEKYKYLASTQAQRETADYDALMKLMKESLEKESNKQKNSLKKLKDSYNKITKFKGTYKVKITFKGNKNYKNAGKTIKIKVKG